MEAPLRSAEARPTSLHAHAAARLPEGLEIRGPFVPDGEAVLTAEALAFVAKLERRFGPRRKSLLARRRDVQAKLDSGWRPDFLPATADLRASDWTVAPLPQDLLDRRVEITGPVDRKMIINALNSGANVFMADFEDSARPTWENVVDGQLNLRDAVARHDRACRAGGQALPPESTGRRRSWCARAAGTSPRSTSSSTASRSRRRSSTSASSSSTTPARCSPAAPARTSTCRRWRATSRRGSGTTCSSTRRTRSASRAARSGDGAHRDDPRRLRDGRDPLRAARALGRPQLRALGLHLQLHQEVPEPTATSCCPTARR